MPPYLRNRPLSLKTPSKKYGVEQKGRTNAHRRSARCHRKKANYYFLLAFLFFLAPFFLAFFAIPFSLKKAMKKNPTTIHTEIQVQGIQTQGPARNCHVARHIRA